MVYAYVKRTVDVAVAATCLVLTAPVLAFIAAWIRLDSRGPVLYRGLRIGRFGRPFTILKFRTMVIDAEALGGSATADDDQRLTDIGRFLRKYKLDELPQFFNVLRGDMSVVGPRPEVFKYLPLFVGEASRILSVRPGLTDWATLWNVDEGAALAGTSDPERVYDECIRPTKTQLQQLYVDAQSLTIDLKILVYTMVKLVNRKWNPREIAAYGTSFDATRARKHHSAAAVSGPGSGLEALRAEGRGRHDQSQ